MKRRRPVPYVVVVPLVYFIAQIATGTDPIFALLTSAAILFGLLSVSAGGGVRSTFGLLNLIMVSGFLLLGIGLKILTLQAADSRLMVPRDTAMVMALGFAGVLAGTWIQKSFKVPFPRLVQPVRSPRMYLALTLIVAVAGTAAYIAVILADASGEAFQSGGIMSAARQINTFRPYSIVFSLFYVWSIRSQRYLTHPLVLSILCINIIIGVISTSKEGAMAPIACYLLMAILRYGLTDRRVLAIGASGAFIYSVFIYPYSQYIRSNGGREGSMSARLDIMQDVIGRMATDDNFRSSMKVDSSNPREGYLLYPALEPFGRLAMIGEADRLISGTNDSSFTGWETITWGFKLAAPSWLYPDKPVLPAGNYLGHVAGDVPSEDYTTQCSYGVMANFYNAFSFPGAFIGTALFFSGFYFVFRCGFGNPRWRRNPRGSTVWLFLLVAGLNHGLLESSVSGLIPVLALPVMVFALCAAARVLALVLSLASRHRAKRKRTRAAQPEDSALALSS